MPKPTDDKPPEYQLSENQILDLPDWSDPNPPAPLSLVEIIALCEKMLPYWNAESFTKPPPPFLDIPFALKDEDLL